MKPQNTSQKSTTTLSSEYLDEFSNRVIAMIESECELLEFLYNHPLCIRDEASSEEEYNLYEDVKLKHDNDFCRVREMLREIKKDEYLLL